MRRFPSVGQVTTPSSAHGHGRFLRRVVAVARGVSRNQPLAGTLVVFAALAVASDAAAHAPAVFQAYGTAVVDGRIAAGEWNRGATGAFEVETPFGRRVATVGIMNDRESLYFAVMIDLPTFAFSRVAFHFDSNHDGLPTIGTDDAFQVDHGVATATDALYHDDEYLCGHDADSLTYCFDETAGGRNDEQGAIAGDGTRVVYEASKPLSGDAHDLNASPGQTVGFLVRWDMIAPPSVTPRTYHSTSWPGLSPSFTAQYGDLVISAAPPITGMQLQFAPAAPVAGRLFALHTAAVVRAGGITERADATSCTARVAGRLLLRRGACSWIVPRASKRKRLLVQVAAQVGDETRTAVRSFRIR